MDHWQKEWDESDTGRLTYRFIPDIGKFLKNKHFRIDTYLTQAITGHGNLKSYLFRFKLRNDDKCDCLTTKPQNSEHLIFECGKFNIIRNNLERAAILNGFNWPCELKLLIDNKELFNEFKNFLKNSEALKPSFDTN